MPAPRVVRAAGWHFVRFAASGERKPGYVAARRGSTLELDLLQAGRGFASFGYLRSSATTAAARVECVSPCVCQPQALSALNSRNYSITRMSRALAFSSLLPCHVSIALVSDGPPFKFISVYVWSAQPVRSVAHGSIALSPSVE
jgi:hypothetical protein